MKYKSELKKYLSEIGITIKEAAEIIGLSRPYLTMIANGTPCGKHAAIKIELWSCGKVSRDSLMFPNWNRTDIKK